MKMIRRNDTQSSWRDERGFTVVELGIALSAMAVIAAVSLGAFRQFAEATSARKAAVQIAADVGLTRSFAIQRRDEVSMVVDETNLTYVIRDAAGQVLMRRDFGTGSEIALSTILISAPGDSLTFNSRGLLTQGAVRFDVSRRDHAQQLDVNALGRTTLN